jgi:hypothetical protein
MARATSNQTPAQMFALAFGVVYLLVGLVGFAVTGFDEFASETGEKLILFEINPLQNIIHIAVGALWLGASSKHSSAKRVNTLIGAVYLALAVLGFAGALDTLISNNTADSFLHLATGALSLYFGTAGAEGPGRTTTTV